MKLTNNDVIGFAKRLAQQILQAIPHVCIIRIYPIPRGGIPAAYATLAHMRSLAVIVDNPVSADCFIDDLIDSGETREWYAERYPEKPFFALLDKAKNNVGSWVVFPWESTEEKDDSFSDNVVRLLQFIGEDPKRGGLLETPDRVAKAWKHWTSGYKIDIPKLMKVFEDGGERYNQMVIVKDIPVYSHCEHHMAPIIGTVTIAYIPNGKIVGLSKLSRLADAFARRLQVQERMTDQIADALVEHLAPLGVGVLMRARHLCMESRGVCQQGHHTITTALRGAIMSEPQAREEFLLLSK